MVLSVVFLFGFSLVMGSLNVSDLFSFFLLPAVDKMETFNEKGNMP